MITPARHYKLMNRVGYLYSKSNYNIFGTHQTIEQGCTDLIDILKELHGLEVSVILCARKLSITVTINHHE